MSSRAPERFEALDGWRGVAAVGVAIFHFPAVSSIFDLPLARNAWLFVDLFFLLSGFVIAANYRDRFASGYPLYSFMWLRLGRLYPLHLFILLCYLVTEIALASGAVGIAGDAEAFSERMAPTGFLTSLLLIQSMGFHDGLVWNGVAWSISTEFWMYALFAAVALSLARWLDMAMAAFIAAAVLLLSLDLLYPETLGRFVDFSRCVYGFALGVLAHSAYLWITRGRSRSDVAAAYGGVRAATAFEAVAASIAILFVIYGVNESVHVWAPLAFAPLVFAFAFDAGLISRMLQWRFFAFLGLISYSIYMVHPFLQGRVMKPMAAIFEKITGVRILSEPAGDVDAERFWGFETWQGDLWTLVMLATVLTASWLTYRFIEAPGRSAMRRMVERAASNRASAGGQRA